MTQEGGKPIAVKYVFTFANGQKETFDFSIDRQTMTLIEPEAADRPEWTRLSFQKCAHCPLEEEDHPDCPAAVNLMDLAKRLGKVVSYEKTELAVLFDIRWTAQNTTAQRGISSLMGLLMAISDCPYMHYMKPMARFHLPLSSMEETVQRASAMYLQAQYFIAREGGAFDHGLKGLAQIYDDLQKVNAGIAHRLRQSGEIHELNALAVLDQFAQSIPYAIEDSLDQIRYLYAPYLKD